MLYKFTLIFCACLFAVYSPANVSAIDGETDPFFVTGIGFNDDVRDIALQSDGKLIVGGEFIGIAGVPFNRIGRLTANGNLDPTFTPGTGANGHIFTVKVLPDDKILIGGIFTAYNGAAANRIARLNPNGTLDTSFNTGAGASYIVNAIAVQPDGKILIGGEFDTFNGTQSRMIARLNADGSLDQTFHSPLNNASGIVFSIALQADGKILIGGSFGTEDNLSNSFVRLNANGNLDATFQNGSRPQGTVRSIVVEPDGNILIGGDFTSVSNTPRAGLARMTSAGALDTSFTGADVHSVLKIVLQTDGKILLCGMFTRPQGLNWTIIRLNANGTADESFTRTEITTVNSITVAPDNKIFAGGYMSRLPAVGGAQQVGARKFNADGTRDDSYVTRTGATEGVIKLKILPDNKIMINGGFSEVGGLPRTRLARLNPDGTLDAGFNTSIQVNVFAVQPDGKIIVAERFASPFRLLRLNADGGVDPTFTANTGTAVGGNPNVNAIAVQPDGKIVVVGSFETVNGVARRGIARLNSDGSVDSSFNPNFIPANFTAVIALPDGKTMVAGLVEASSGSTFYAVLRLNANGTGDGAFSFANPNNFITEMAMQPDGKVLISGRFTTVNAAPVRYVARLNPDGLVDGSFIPPLIDGFEVTTILLQQNSKVIIGGGFDTVGGVSRPRLARLNANGSLDTSFSVAFGSGGVNSIGQQSDGKLIIGGTFTLVNGFQRFATARLLNTPKSALFDFDGDGRADISVFRPADGVWYLNRSSQGFTAVQFGISTDKIAPADYDGDGKTDFAVFRDNTWYLQRSSAGFTAVQFGAAGDIPQPADYDGDGKAELAVFRPSDGGWYVLNLVNGQFNAVQFGANGDKPVVADYDGDGKADYAVFRPADGTWYLLRSQAGFTGVQFGIATDKPVVGDYDGDGKSDPAVYRDGVWYQLRSSQGFAAVQFGIATDLPAPADFDGDGKTDIAVFRDGNWYLQQTTQGFSGFQFGAVGDKPVPNAFVP
jgi:uncharacterized delta-60 repeat protein